MPLALGVLVLAGCKDDDMTKYGEWNAAEDYADVSFVEISENVELDPTDPTTYTLRLSRRNPNVTEIREQEKELYKSLQNDTLLTDAQRDSIYNAALKRDSAVLLSNWPEIDVPITITNATEDGIDTVFTISKAHFDKGEEYGTCTINFPKAEIGKEYSLQLAVTDPKYVSYYSDAATSSVTISRVKWNLLGTGTFTDAFWYEASGAVEIYQKDNDPNTFRIPAPFDNVAANAGKTLDGHQSAYMILKLLQRNDMIGDVSITKDDLVYFSRTNTGYLHQDYGAYVEIFHPADLYAEPTEDLFMHSIVKSYQKDPVEVNGKKQLLPGQIQLAPYYYMVGVGGWNKTGEDDIVLINFPGYVPTHQASLEEDFDWQPVMTAEFLSSGWSLTGEATLYKGVCTTTTDKCDSVFYANYGVPYVLEAPYVEGNDLVFFVKDGRITIPNDMKEDYEYQPTGLTSTGNAPVYAKINASSSTFSEYQVKLNISFVTLDKDGRVALDLGAFDEVLSKAWDAIGTADYAYVALADEGEDPDVDENLEMDKNLETEGLYRLRNWGFVGSDLLFTWNGATNAVTIPEQSTNFEYGAYGEVMISDLATYTDQGYEKFPCYFDAETSTFYVAVVYYVEAGELGYGMDQFTYNPITGSVKAVSKSAIKFNGKPSQTLKRAMPWQRIMSKKGPKKAVNSQKKNLSRVITSTL